MRKTLEELQKKADNLRNSGRVKQAIKAYLEIVDISQQSELYEVSAEALRFAGLSATLEIKRGISSAYRDALKYFSASEQIYKDIKNNVKIGGIYRDIAVADMYAGENIKALKFFQKSIEILRSNDRVGSLAVTLGKLAVYYYLSNDLIVAKDYMKKSLKLFKEDPIRGHYQAEAWLDYARILARNGDTNEAIEWAEQSLDWYLADHDGEVFSVNLAKLYGLLSLLYDRVNSSKQAKRYAATYEKLTSSFDPLVSQALRSQLAETFEREK